MITDVYGDPQLLRRRVRDLREQGEDIRALALSLVARTEQLAWTGRAATALTARVTERAERLHATAGRHDTAADALAVHGEHVHDAQDRIAAIEERFDRLVEAARGRVEALAEASAVDGLRREPDPADDRLLAFTPPPPGHRAWLDVDLPGL
jgi:methyl-accepting chemotaxis protein